jgi:hypothetical protein
MESHGIIQTEVDGETFTADFEARDGVIAVYCNELGEAAILQSEGEARYLAEKLLTTMALQRTPSSSLR